jgi:5S rRNA maturation endonuclease (ribonuclease M5)
MTAYIVCEGERDAQLLKRLLPEEFVSNVEIVAAGGISAVKSLARSLIVRRQSPVAIVADADVIIPEQVEQRLKDTEEIVGNIAANTPVKVILAVPTLETIFFQDISLLSRLLGYAPSQDMLSLAVHQPWQALKQLISQSSNLQSQSQLVEQLTNEELEILRKTPVVQEVIQFLRSVRETADVL